MSHENTRIMPKIFIIFVSVAGIICSTAVLFPQIQRLIIRLAEYLIHRKVNFYDDWMYVLAAWARTCIFLILTFDFFTLTASGKKLLAEVISETGKRLRKIDKRSFLKPFLLLSGIYLAGYISLIRADYLYADDIDRAVEGYHGWSGWSRYAADILSTVIHADIHLAEISPLPQIMAIFLMGLNGVLLVYLLNDGKLNPTAIFAAVPLGLSPYFLENMSYKYDAPYMALSVFTGIVPFLFLGSRKSFVFVSIVSLLVMCMSYQASTGIYIIVAVILLYKAWNDRQQSRHELLIQGGLSLVSFCASLLVFRMVFMVQGATGHGVATSVWPANLIISGTIKNLAAYALTINKDFGIIWKVLIAFLSCLFVIYTGNKSRGRGMIRYVVSFCVLVLLFISSYGVYLFLEKPLFAPRALYGFGVFIAVIGIYLVSFRTKAAIIGVCAVSWCFFVFAFSYGNALADQKRYNTFKVELLLSDLSVLFPDRTSSDPEIRIENDTGFGPLTRSIAKQYPVIKRIIPGSRHYHTYKYMLHYFSWEEGKPWDTTPGDLPVVLDSYYHTIRSDGKHIVVTFK